MQYLTYAEKIDDPVNRHAAAVGMYINASKTNMSALIPGEQRQAVLLDG